MRSILRVLPLLVIGAAAVAPAPACVVPDISSGADAGSATPAASGADAGTTATTQGASCTQVTSTIALCKYISSCPNLVLNAQVLPECGFRIHGDAIDPECVCGNYLCPIGAPTTCAEATSQAGGDTTYDSVCEQSLQGHCTQLATGGSTSSACQACVQNCDNVPSCIDACGC